MLRLVSFGTYQWRKNMFPIYLDTGHIQGFTPIRPSVIHGVTVKTYKTVNKALYHFNTTQNVIFYFNLFHFLPNSILVVKNVEIVNVFTKKLITQNRTPQYKLHISASVVTDTISSVINNPNFSNRAPS